jgi:opacity protein-like surface antigen
MRAMALLMTMVVALAGIAAPAAAEWTIDLYGGAAWLPPADLDVSGSDNTRASVQGSLFDIHTDTALTVGTRFGYWLESVPFLGFDLDLFYMHVPIPKQTRSGTARLTGEFLDRPISVSINGTASIPDATLPLLGFAPEIRLRWPLMVDNAFPKGRLQPYLSAGPAWAFSLDNEELTVELGGKVGVGLAFNLARWIALFGEYRYIFYPGMELTDRNLTYKADIKTHSVVLGVSLRF